MAQPRQQRIIPVIKEVIENTSGFDVRDLDQEISFLEIGLDSLALTQVAIELKNEFKVNISFRQLMEDYYNLETLANFLDQNLPPDAFAEESSQPIEVNGNANNQIPSTSNIQNNQIPSPSNIQIPIPNIQNNQIPLIANTQISISGDHMNTNQALVAQQLQIMAQQLQLLNGARVNSTPMMSVANNISSNNNSQVIPTPSNAKIENQAKEKEKIENKKLGVKKNRGPGVKITKKAANVEITAKQKEFLGEFMKNYISLTKTSKEQTQLNRSYLADPRTVSGFTPMFKEIVYPIVVDRSSGSKLWDIDGNEYIDITNGFGMNFFGWSPPFVTEAVKAQLDQGIEIGPQTPLAGKVAKLFTEITGLDRVAFCNTGSEAVMASMRLARTITGRKTIVTFSGDYHGTFDEVLVRSGPNMRSFPIASGLMPSMFENILVLDYDSPESLEIIRSRADELAGILIEPVRSRYPETQPKEFLHELRRITEKSGTAFIMDEVVTGFRCHQRGAQGHFGLKADLATYGKVVGGGLPIGLVAGTSKFMDGLDGGFWQFGDDSVPEVGVTFFAGTFVRHPLALAAAHQVLLKLKEEGNQLQESLNQKVENIVIQLNEHFKKVGAPIKIALFSSFFYINYTQDIPYGSLLFYLLRQKGIHIWEHRPCIFTLAHSEEDYQKIVWAFKESVAQMQIVGFLPNSIGIDTIQRNRCPHPQARLGKDRQGNPAWFIPDPNRSGKYLQLQN